MQGFFLWLRINHWMGMLWYYGFDFFQFSARLQATAVESAKNCPRSSPDRLGFGLPHHGQECPGLSLPPSCGSEEQSGNVSPGSFMIARYDDRDALGNPAEYRSDRRLG
jgi:hypothetical protein